MKQATRLGAEVDKFNKKRKIYELTDKAREYLDYLKQREQERDEWKTRIKK